MMIWGIRMWNSFYDDIYKNKLLNKLIVILLCLAFVVSDWMISIFAFSNFIFIIVLLLIISNNKIEISNNSIITFVILESCLILHILLSQFYIQGFVLKVAVTNFVKLSFYLGFIIIVYHFIKDTIGKKTLFKYLNIVAIITIALGIYISIVITFDLNLPYEFLWAFTRQDISSYIFEENDFFVRTRSVFSEPAHLGYFLNTVLMVNFFSKIFTMPLWVNTVIVFGIIITFSYSSIGVMLIILIVNFAIEYKYKRSKILNLELIVVSLVFVFIIFLFKDIILTAIVNRTYSIVRLEDYSFLKRIIYSWEYINNEHLLLGNGLGHTPPIQNIYAYMISDLGLIAFLASIMFSFLLIKTNIGLGLSFVALNFQKGGYLSPIYWLILLLVILIKYEKKTEEKYEEI